MSDLSSSKGAKDENFPVASFLIAPRHREIVMGFYAVARMADDIADHPALAPERKVALLGEIEATLDSKGDDAPAAGLRESLRERGLSDRHVRDLLTAFRQDATQNRYADWDALMDYCRFSAAPVGRFMLDVHGEDRATWPSSDALCAALQVINHLQDCGKDYRELDRVYLPLDALDATGATIKSLGEPRSTSAMLAVIQVLARRTDDLLDASAAFAGMIRDTRLALEVGVIHRLARDLNNKLKDRDPLADRVHHRPVEGLALAVSGAIETLVWRLGSPQRRRSAA